MKSTLVRPSFARLLALLLALLLWIPCAALGEDTATSRETEKTYVLDLFKDTKLDLTPYAGKAIFLNFFTEWCPFCMQEMPEIKKIFQDYSAQELQIILVHVWDGEDEKNSQSIRETYGLEDMTFFEDEDRMLAQLIGIPGYPTSLFIDKDGNLETAAASALTYENMAQIMDGMGVAKAQAPQATTPPPAPAL